MAYRFTNTGKWADEWFVDLKASEKLMFMYLCENCDSGGFFELSVRKISFDLGITGDEVKATLKGLQRGFVLSIDKRILFLKNFLKHQKNLPLNPLNMAHKGIFKRFENYKNKFDVDLLHLLNNDLLTTDESEIKGASVGLIESPIGIGNGIGKGELEDIKEKNKGVDFENFWCLYGKKVGDKAKVNKKWDTLSVATQKKILEILPDWKSQYTDKQFQPFPETFLNQKRWNDEIDTTKISSNATTNTGNQNANSGRNTAQDKRNELIDLKGQSTEFLRRTSG